MQSYGDQFIPIKQHESGSHKIQFQDIRNLEKFPTKTFTEPDQASIFVATKIAELIRKRQELKQNVVLGLATGSTPLGIYKELIRLHKEENLSFENVITFNLDEYFPIQRTAFQSYYKFMHDKLFDQINIKPENINIPDGRIKPEEVVDFCLKYEQKIVEVGGIDIQILGIGRTGHIGFNEPGSGTKSTTRLINLDRITRFDAASSFFGLDKVPKKSITMGIQTIMNAKEIFLIAYSENKAGIVRSTIEGPIAESIPSTYLQLHKNTTFILDKSAAQELTVNFCPWLVKGQTSEITLNYDDYWTKKAVIWLATALKKPILKLLDEDYEHYGLYNLLVQKGQESAALLNLSIFKQLSKLFSEWPAGGCPDEDTLHYYDEKAVETKKILIFSPHPDDDVICMGGTMQKLIQQGHEVHVAYQTSGNFAVFDYDASRFTDFVKEFSKSYIPNSKEIQNVCDNILQIIEDKKPGEFDQIQTLQTKGLIRKTEARSAAVYVGVKFEHIYNQLLPFYETGKVKKNPLGPADVKITRELIERIKPDQIYAAGDLTDPHGTHRVCLQAIIKALEELKGTELRNNMEVFLYRGAWQEWELENVSLCVPLSPEEVQIKKESVFKHQSQKDRAMYPGQDEREFWQRAQQRNSDTANLCKDLGLNHYEGIECFTDLNWLLNEYKMHI